MAPTCSSRVGAVLDDQSFADSRIMPHPQKQKEQEPRVAARARPCLRVCGAGQAGLSAFASHLYSAKAEFV